LLKAFFYPFWGVAADRVSRKRILVLASTSGVISAWLICFAPSVGVFVATRFLYLIHDLGGSIQNALLRDLFSSSEWERKDGGATGIKSRIAIFTAIFIGFSAGIGMAILKLGEMGVGLPNEYSEKKNQECAGQTYCVPPGKYSWESDHWHVDGSLRLLFLMGTAAVTLELVVVVLFLPETLRPEYQTADSLWTFSLKHWRDFATPWNNLRVFATKDLRALASVRCVHYCIGSGGAALFMTWYRRHEPDTLTMYTVGAAMGATTFLTLFAVGCIVDRFGDLRGLWAPSNAISIVFGLGVALIPASLFHLCFPIFAVCGFAGALTTFTPELLAKLIPADIQGTFQTSKAFLYDIQKAVLMWPWLGLLVCSQSYPYPLDALAIWVALVLGVLALVLTIRQFPHDPKDAIQQGKALDAFWKTPYVLGGKDGDSSWYERHGGRLKYGLSELGGHIGTMNSKVSKAIEAWPQKQSE
jgi:MFS family permease